jgi:tetratricopeptide (TPR) repeat protein
MKARTGWLVVGLGAVACGGPPPASGPTFARDIAPLVYQSCSPCHRPGQPAPFSLLSYADVHKKRTQIVEVTKKRLMPPWLMTHGDFEGDRRLRPEQIALLEKWVENGAPRGDESAEPPAPTFASGWQLREPDLIVTAPEALSVPADGPNVFRNLVIPVAAGPLRYVEAIEIRPESRAVHHAVLAVDATRESRRLDALDAEPGFPGMIPGAASPPDGHFLGWTPGKQVRRNAPGMAWRLYPGNDLVLQVHLVPTGKPETVQPRIGLYFTDVPTAIEPYPVVLFSDQIDLPPGERDFVLRDHVTVPVPITVHRLYPHAHYLCRRMRAWATLPDGVEQELFRIDAWDFDWQDDYECKQAVQLPAGTTLSMEYHYDNSADNPANPHRPPQHVGFGQESTDEMGTLTLMVTIANRAERLQLAEACHVRDLEKAPHDNGLRLRLAGILREMGRSADALAAVNEVLQRAPDDVAAWFELGLCHEKSGNFAEAERAYGEALKRDAGHGGAHLQLGSMIAPLGRTKEAIAHFEAALLVLPNVPLLHCNLGTARFVEGELPAAERSYRRALELDSNYTNAMFLLGRVLLQQGRKPEARVILQRAAKARPGDAAIAKALAEAGE